MAALFHPGETRDGAWDIKGYSWAQGAVGTSTGDIIHGKNTTGELLPCFLVLQECPMCIMPHSPRSILQEASLTLCVDICMHTHKRMDRHQRCPLHPTIQFESSLNPFTTAGGMFCGLVTSGEGMCAGGTLMELLRCEGCGWPWGDQIVQLCLRSGMEKCN